MSVTRQQENIVVVGLGYVGLPLAVSLARVYYNVMGYAISELRVVAWADGPDWTGKICDSPLVGLATEVLVRPVPRCRW